MTDQNEMLQQNIAKQIEDAFADTPYPGDNNIGWGCGSEGAEFEEALRGKHWKVLTLEFIFYHRTELPCMTPAGFRFYLPAFMLATLNHYAEMDTLSDSLIFILAPPQNIDTKHHELFSRRIANFNPAEQRAILAFLGTFLVLHPEDFGYDGWESVYKGLLVSAITFWQSKVGSETGL